MFFRYLLYEINPGEGFNLRRDVYMRMANLVKVLNEDLESWWTLVLPPWSRLYHWRSHVIQQQIPWSTFFDTDSLSRYVPVMEFVDFLNGTFCKLEVYKTYLFFFWFLSVRLCK